MGKGPSKQCPRPHLYVPPEVLCEIFRRVECGIHLYSFSQVSRAWMQAATDEAVWKHLYEKHFSLPDEFEKLEHIPATDGPHTWRQRYGLRCIGRYQAFGNWCDFLGYPKVKTKISSRLPGVLLMGSSKPSIHRYHNLLELVLIRNKMITADMGSERWRHAMLEARRETKEFASFVERGLTPPVRSLSWPHMIGNARQLTARLYHSLEEKAERMLGEQGESDALPQQLIRAGDAARLTVAQMNTEHPQLYRKMLAMWGAFRPDIGIYEGLPYLLTLFLHHLPLQPAFTCLCNLHESSFYTNLTTRPHILSQPFECIARHAIPELLAHFGHMAFDPLPFLSGWVKSGFVMCVEVRVAVRIVDMYLLRGPWEFMRALVTIFKSLQADLLACDQISTIYTLQHIRERTCSLNEQLFFQLYRKVKLPSLDERRSFQTW
eukprot:gnl/Trimastix_PCT/3466.p1 GENE.gnl/Trimastix_PCT/3466~~gnl/Trimastix_PCT/3466.p1  ORF type:complete len:434 (-),score=46.69 gnl/Trimastix_PCT/3466:58-1359(-)